MADGGLHDLPTAAQLLEAVRDFLSGEVMVATEGRVRFHARVAANVLAIVQRELELGDAAAAAHRQGLARLGVGSEAELAAAIRAGALDHRYDEVLEVVRETVRAKLAVANPAHLTGHPHRGPDGRP